MTSLSRWLSKPAVSMVLRKTVELNFHTQKKLITQYFLPMSAGDRVLDIGCGSGEFSSLFPPHQYVGIDVDKENLAYARKRFAGEFLHADATRLPFPDASFSHVLIMGMLHHLNDADAAAALGEAARVVKPKGLILIMEDTVSARPLTRVLHRIDQGAFIRTYEEWKTLIGAHFKIEEDFTFYNSICFYSAFFLTIL